MADANELLAHPPLVGLAMSRSLGFIVIGRLAARIGVTVRLIPSPTGGVTAIVSLPATIVEDTPPAAGRAARTTTEEPSDRDRLEAPDSLADAVPVGFAVRRRARLPGGRGDARTPRPTPMREPPVAVDPAAPSRPARARSATRRRTRVTPVRGPDELPVRRPARRCRPVRGAPLPPTPSAARRDRVRDDRGRDRRGRRGAVEPGRSVRQRRCRAGTVEPARAARSRPARPGDGRRRCRR